MGEEIWHIMTETQRQQLLDRNKRIIDAVVEKGKRVCPDAIDIIAVTGSFASGDYYERSDLDLLILINDDSGWKVAKCFILGDTAHDLYCHTWRQLEHMAEYNNPHAIKLLQVDIVYARNEAVTQKYYELRRKLLNQLGSPLNRGSLSKIRKHYDSALNFLAQICMEDDYSKCRYLSAGLLIMVEYVVYMVNRSYIRHGIKGIPREILSLDKLPHNFKKDYNALIYAQDMQSLTDAAKNLLRSVGAFIAAEEKMLSGKKTIDADALRGTYEEIWSNWKNKMARAAETGDKYLSLMSAASCQKFYDDMYEEYDIRHYQLFGAWEQEPDCAEVAEIFDDVMEQYRALYDQKLLAVSRYRSIDEFIEDYQKIW